MITNKPTYKPSDAKAGTDCGYNYNCRDLSY